MDFTVRLYITAMSLKLFCSFSSGLPTLQRFKAILEQNLCHKPKPKALLCNSLLWEGLSEMSFEPVLTIQGCHIINRIVTGSAMQYVIETEEQYSCVGSVFGTLGRFTAAGIGVVWEEGHLLAHLISLAIAHYRPPSHPCPVHQ